MKKAILYISTGLLCFMFGMGGLVKLTPAISPDTYNEMKSHFREYARVPPFNKIGLDPSLFMLMVGIVEVSCVAAILLPINLKQKVLATWVLVGVMAGALYMHFMVGDGLKEAMPAIMCSVLCVLRLFLLGSIDPPKIRLD